MTNSSPYSLGNFLKFLNENFAILFLVMLAFGSGFFVGSMWTERKMLLSGGVKAPSVAAQPTASADPAAQAPQGPTADQLAQVPEVTDADHQKGPKNAKITLIEYSDFECPFCKSFYPTVQQIMQEYGDQVRVVYRHYPLPFHAQAMPTAEASECAAEQLGADAFWQYHDAIFSSSSEVTASTALDIAEQVGANRQSVQECMDSDKFVQKINDQMAGGSAAGVNGTPGTVIVTDDGQYDIISGALPYEQVKQLLEQYL
jgi:protein-disulfide isomerase